MIIFLMYYVRGDMTYGGGLDSRSISTASEYEVENFRHPDQHIIFKIRRVL